MRATSGPEPLSVAPDVELKDARELMRSWGTRHLPVTEKDGSVVGLLTERDIDHHMTLYPGKRGLTVREAMNPNPFVVTPEESLAVTIDTMARNRHDCAVVADGQGICGIFTTTDALRILAHMLKDPVGQTFHTLDVEGYLRNRTN